MLKLQQGEIIRLKSIEKTQIDPKAKIADSATISSFCIIGENVQIGEGTYVGPHTIIEGHTVIGKNNYITGFVSLGTPPQDLKYDGEKTKLEIGDNNQIREFVTIHRASVDGNGKTKIANNNMFMAYSHIAHDCTLGNGNVLVNGATLAGHVSLDNNIVISGFSAINQFARLGSYSFLTAGSMVSKDVPPFCSVAGDRARLLNINEVGLKRNGFDLQDIKKIKKSFRILFFNRTSLQSALEEIKCNKELSTCFHVLQLVNFIENSKNGIVR